MELLGSLDEPSPAELRQEEWSSGVDESLVADISSLIMELDEKVLKSVVAGLDPALLASLIQAMEPIAHDRLFSCAPSSRSKKILNALEAAQTLSLNELTRRAQIFAQKVLSELAPRNRRGAARSLQLSASLRQHLTSILSRE
jgi:Mg/Co/Ni transporter MgtE